MMSVDGKRSMDNLCQAAQEVWYGDKLILIHLVNSFAQLNTYLPDVTLSKH